MERFLHLLHEILIASVVVNDHVSKRFPLLVTPLVSDPLLALFHRKVVAALESFHGGVMIHLHDPDLRITNGFREHFVHQVVPFRFEQNCSLHDDDRLVASDA